MAILCVPRAQFSCTNTKNEQVNQHARVLKVLITSYKHFTTFEALTHKLIFTYGAQKPYEPPKPPR